MKGFNPRIDKWIWVFYPVSVVLLILFATSYFMSIGEISAVKLASRQEEVEAREKVVSELRVKLNKLTQVDKNKSLEDVQRLLTAVPASKKAWLVVEELQRAASVSGAVIASYRGSVGDVTEASDAAKMADSAYNSALSMKAVFEVSEFGQVIKILGVLERSLPLIKINKVTYDDTNLTVTLDGAWMAWKNLTAGDVGSQLPDYEAEVKKALDSMSGMEKWEELTETTVAAGGVN